MNIRELFAKNLRDIRQEKDFTQEDLAYEAEVDRAHVSKIERGKTNVSLELIERFSNALGVPPHAFFQPIGQKRKAVKRG